MCVQVKQHQNQAADNISTFILFVESSKLLLLFGSVSFSCNVVKEHPQDAQPSLSRQLLPGPESTFCSCSFVAREQTVPSPLHRHTLIFVSSGQFLLLSPCMTCWMGFGGPPPFVLYLLIFSHLHYYMKVPLKRHSGPDLLHA